MPRGRSLLGRVQGSIGRSARARKRVSALAAAVREHVVTFAAFAAVDYGAFQASHVAGWVTGGVLLLVFDWKVQG
jgi:hypothetical protein